MESNRELDLQVAKHIFSFVDNPDEWASIDETWFWIHPNDGVLIGESWTSYFHQGNYDHQWHKFCPSSNLEHTNVVLKYYEEKNIQVKMENSYGRSGWYVKIGENPYIQAETLSLAICRAVVQ